jgi:hypothetical protein
MQQELSSQWLSKDDVTTNGTAATIARITQEEVGSDRDLRFAIHFQGNIKPMILNKTNTRILVALFGHDSDGWLGKTITVYNDPTVGYAGQITGGVRIRMASAPMLPAVPRQPTAEEVAAYMRAKNGGADPHMAGLEDSIPF